MQQQINVVRAAITGDGETVKKWLSSPHTKNSLQVAKVLGTAAHYGHDKICQLMLNSGKATMIY